MESTVEFQVAWPSGPPNTGHPLLDDSLGQFSINVGDDVVTRFRTENGVEGNRLFVPTYHVAEWAASNWWALLYEPPKRDDYQEDFDFRSRHWLGSARNGFALPDLWFCPTSGKVELTGLAVHLPSSRLAFLTAISEAIGVQVVSQALSHFIEQVISRLDERGRKNTDLHQAWDLVRKTPADVEEYCRLTGALGLSPYDEHPKIDEILDIISASLPAAIVRDLCETADEKTLGPLADMTVGVVKTLGGAPELNFAELFAIPLPMDINRFAWQHGKEAANRVRKYFHISNADPQGSRQFFDKLNLDPAAAVVGESADQINGALQRDEANMRLAILESREPQQRFAAARAAFLGWATASDGARLVTAAITRDQQASRAFAAEILVPTGFIRTKARNRLLSDRAIQEIAETLNAPSGAVAYQASHAGIHVTQSSFW